jgi:hypothetical protein
MPNEHQTKSPRPPRSLRFVFAAILIALLSPIAAFVAWGRIEAARLGRAFDALEARHEPLDRGDFEMKPATDAQREASRVYAEAARFAGDQPLTWTQIADTAKLIEQLCQPPANPARQSERVRALRSLEAPYARALESLDRATRLDAVGWDERDRPRRGSMEELRPRNIARLNAIRIARLACAANDGDEAANALLATLRLRRVVPLSLFGSTTMRTAHSLENLLTFTSPAPSLLQQLQIEYEKAADEHTVEQRVRFQRAQWLYFTLPGVLSDLPPGYTPSRISPFGAIVMRLARPMRDHGIVAELREFDEALAAASQPWPDKLAAATAMTSRYRSRSRRTLTRPLMPHIAGVNLEAAVMNAAETLASARVNAGALALARYRHAHGGALPASLNHLVPLYLSAPPIDPYTGRELKYLHDGESYKIYSVGINRQDDGGTWDQHSDLQDTRRGNPLDIGIAVGAPAGPGR